MDVFSESGETHEFVYTNAALAPGLPNVSRLTQEKITGRAADAIYLNRSHWTANDGGSRIGQSAGYNAQIGVDTKLDVHYDWGVNGRLKQLDATYPDSYGSGTPAVSHWRAGYEFGNAADGNLLTRLLRQRVDGAGAEDWVDSLYTYEAGRDNLLSVTNRTLITPNYSTWQLQPPPAAPFTTSVHTYTTNHLGQRTQQHQALNAYLWGTPGNVRNADRNYGYNERGEVAVATTANANFTNQQAENEQFVYDQIGNRQWHSRGETAPGSVPTDSTTAPAGASTYTASKANTYNAVNGADGGTVPGVQKYDADANLIDDGAFTYVWDSENRLISLAPKVAQAHDHRITFRYDWLSRRRERTSETYLSSTWANSELSKFLYDGWNPILEVRSYGAGTPLLNQFIWGTDLSGSLQGAGGVGGLLFVHQQYDDMAWMEDGTSLYTYDGNGNVSEVIGGTGYSEGLEMDLAGRTLGQFRYDAFGRTLLNYEGDLGAGNADPSVITVPFTFSTKLQDQTSALHYIWQFNSSNEQWEGIQNPRCRTVQYYGYRYLSVDTGRWLNRDPIEEEGGVNLLDFVANNAVSAIDLLGWQLVAARPVRAPSVTPLPGQAVPVTGEPVVAGLADEPFPLPPLPPKPAYIDWNLPAFRYYSDDPPFLSRSGTPTIKIPFPRPKPPIPLLIPGTNDLVPLDPNIDARVLAKIRRCKSLYDKLDLAKENYSKDPLNNARTCAEAADAISRLQMELQLRKDYINAGCDEYDWRATGGSPGDRKEADGGQIRDKDRAVQNALEKYWRQCTCPDGTPKPPNTPYRN